MKIGSSGSNISFSNLNITNIAEEKADVIEEKTENAVQSDSEEILNTAVESKSANSSQGLGRLNLIARSFVHQEQEGDEDNYSLRNLKASQANSNMMAKYNLIINGIIDYRLDRTETLIDAGISIEGAKAIAGSEALAMGEAAHEKVVDDVNEKHLEEEAKEAKEDIETRTEEVVEKKQEETKTEAKESEAKDVEAKTDPDNAEAKVSESNPETVNPAQTVQSGVESGSTESIASGSVGVEAVSSATEGSVSAETGNSLPNAGTSKKVDMLV
ncbi:hypothetical protein [Desulfovibrio sp. UCD-KL4C]|uniref:hypothetical protein n=1 Tax=Desulfovibrio sp. UCD-KL4C TaxID=2578120 RepID=UPI0025BC980E|nr:hypothetical protein [Desulfovibrio sp. UCD-KL4C]